MPEFVNPIGAGAKPSRVDMGVDYTGNFSLYALGAGTIVNVYNSGWPGGKFIGLHLDSGQYVYYAENINPNVVKGQRVTAGQLVGTAINAYPYVEVGWAAPPGTGETMAAATGQANKVGDPGAFSTGYGEDMSNLIKSLGGPAGITTPGGVRGSVPAGFDPSGTATLTSASGNLLQGCLPLVGVVYYAVQCCKRVGRVQGKKSAKRQVLLKKATKQRTRRIPIARLGSRRTQSRMARQTSETSG